DGFDETESSWREIGFPGWAREAFAGEALGPCASATVAATRKLSAKRSFRQAQQTHHFLCSLTVKLIFLARFRQTSGEGSFAGKANEIVPYNLYRSRFLCRCAFMRLRRLCLAIFAFLRFLSEPIQIFSNCGSIESSNSPQCKCSRRFAYLVSCDGPAAAFFLSCAPIPIFFRNGSTDCLRPRNFSIDSLTSRESPGS